MDSSVGRWKSFIAGYPGKVTPGLSVPLSVNTSEPSSAFSDGYQVFGLFGSVLRTPPEATRWFHSETDIFCCSDGRQASPEPLMTPAPVIATLVRSLPEMRDWHRTDGRPA